MNPAQLKKQLKDNATDLNDFYKDLMTWGEDMKRKEEALQKPEAKVDNNNISAKKKKVTIQKEKSKRKVAYTDYSAWDKFDADAACEEIDYDENNESELSDECDETIRDQAYLEKEQGNKYVVEKKWNEAIESYNRAINLYSYDPVFYANRALCFLKTENYMQAELDCTMSLRLDKTYVKAYQRRAAAKQALGKLDEAESDYLRVLELEPKNKESKMNLEVLRQKLLNSQKERHNLPRPVSKFTASRNRQNHSVNQHVSGGNNESNVRSTCNEMKLEKQDCQRLETDTRILVKAVNKPIHLQSKKLLHRVNIQDVEKCGEIIANSCMGTEAYSQTLKTDDLKVIERHSQNSDYCEITKNLKNSNNSSKMHGKLLEIYAPKNYVQFYSQWKQLKTVDYKYDLLKLIKPENVSNIFKESLDSTVFSEVLEVLTKCFIKNNEGAFEFLKFFSELRRFSTIVMLLSDIDKRYLRNLFEYAKKHEQVPKEEIDLLIGKYDLKN